MPSAAACAGPGRSEGRGFLGPEVALRAPSPKITEKQPLGEVQTRRSRPRGAGARAISAAAGASYAVAMEDDDPVVNVIFRRTYEEVQTRRLQQSEDLC
jgi:hypothetical protein